ncbi:MAG: lamin tail domain-containing protein, partial [Bacteroidota bacterium]
DALRIAVSTPLSLEIHFSENLDIATAENSENYSLDFGYGNPVMAVLNDDDASIVEIVYADTLIYGERMILGIQNVSDLSGNALIYSSLDFAYYKAERYDVIINEIMADPSPPQSLPEYEYLELYNTTDLPLDLSGWTLIIGSAEKELRGLQIVPYGYLIIGKDEATNEFLPFGDYYGLESFSLLNSGQSIVLTNKEQEIIHSLRYDERWYGDDEKSDGGWSLEQINPYNPCMMADNWGASGNIRGGSPGNVNSLLDELYIVPSIKNVCAQDSVRIRLEFNQAIHNSIVLHPEYFSIDHNAGEPQAILPEDPYFSSFTIYPSEPLYKSIIYELSCYAEISNCIGDVEYLSEEVSFGVPEKPSPEDIIINEILFNPFPGGVDYIELYNRSQKPINLKGFSLASVSNHAIAYSDTLIHSLDVSCNVLLPGEYVLLCKDFYKVDDYYSCPEENTVIEMTGFPSYGNESGCVILFDDAQNILDAFCYHEDMHYPLFNFVEGVSLERIHYDRPSSDATNWHSASQMSGFGTPGYQNSQFSLISDISSKISISPKVFTPGVDGVRDNISIQYKLDTPGCLATMLIFNSSGQLVRHLVNNELLGTEGSYSWDGIKDDRQKALAGMYIIFIELIDLNGKVDRYKETLVIAP